MSMVVPQEPQRLVVHRRYDQLSRRISVVQPPQGPWALDLDFRRDELDPRLVITAPGPKTYWDAEGILRVAPPGTWPIEWDPLTRERRGRSVWEARTNQWRWSDDLTNGIGTSRSGIEQFQPAAEGWFKAPESTNNSAHHVNAPFSVTPGQYTVSVDLMAAERTFAILRFDTSSTAMTGGTVQATLNLVTGELSGITPGWEGLFRVARLPEGWRFSVTVTASVSGTIRPLILIALGTSNFGYQGDGTSGFFIRRPQFGPATSPGPYIPTEGAAVTRPAERVTMPTAMDWYNQFEGTWVLEMETFADFSQLVNQRFLTVSDGSAQNYYGIFSGGGPSTRRHMLVRSVTAGAASQDSYFRLDVPTGSRGVYVLAYSVEGLAVSYAGAIAKSSGPVPRVASELAILCGGGVGGNFGNARAARLRYASRRLSDAELQSLSAL